MGRLFFRWGVAAFASTALPTAFAVAVPGERAAGAEATTRPTNRQVEQLVAQMAEPNPAVREKARLMMLNLGGDAYEAVEAELAEPGLSSAVRLVLKAAEPRLEARARPLAQQKRDDAWERQSLIAEWNRVGHKDPRWNIWVEDGIVNFSRNAVAARRAALQNFEKAIGAGCDDAMVLYLRARSRDPGAETVPDELAEPYRAAAQAILASNYSAGRKMITLARYFHVGKDLPADIPADTLIKLAIEASKDSDVPRSEIWNAMYGISPKLCAKDGWDGDFGRLNPAFQQAFPHQWYAPYFTGIFNVYWAWNARGSGWADSVTPQGWRLFEGRIETAQRALQQAWKLDPMQSAIYEQMVTVCMAKSDKAGLDLWFRRGIEANPDDYQLCQNKMNALMPRWMGSHQEMLAFGRECAATHNHYGSIPQMIVNAHELISRESPNAEQYVLQPEVWDDIHQALEDRLLLYPTRHNRSRYVQWAARCGRWEVITPQCRILGNHPDPAVFPDPAAYDAIRQKAQEHAPETGGQTP